MAVFNRFSTTDRAALSFTGNTLGLIGTFNPSQASTSAQADGIGTFITTNTALQSPGGYPAGTTQTFSLNRSAAVLTLLPGSTVLYAELIWSGSSSNALQNVSSSINNAVQLTTPLGATFNVSPNPSTSQNIPNIFFNVSAYARTANVTSIVSQAGAGTYTISNVPGALGGNNTSNPGDFESNFLGWTLAVIYRNPLLNFRNVTLWVLFNSIGPSGTLDVPITGFATPSSGPLSARLAVSAVSGDSYISGDTLSFGPTSSLLTQLSGPNNISTNFFSSQVNNGNSESTTVGQLDRSGTFGNNNQPIGTKSINGRQGFDVTNVNASSAITYNQTNAVVRFVTSGDLYLPTALGLQVDINAANLISITKYVDKQSADINETLTYTVVFTNTGTTTAINTVFVDTTPTNTIYVPNSVIIDGVTNPGNPNSPGIPLGDIAKTQVKTITFNVITTTIASPNPVTNRAGVGYIFQSSPSLPFISAFDLSSVVNTQINHVDAAISKTGGKSIADVGDILTYTIPIRTVGNVTALNVVLIDTLPNGTSFLSSTLTQDGVSLSGNPSPPGASLNNIPPGKVSTISFKVRVTAIPAPNPFQNSVSTIFTYTINSSTTPNTTGQNGASSNFVQTKVNNANFNSATKYVDKPFADCNEEIKYTIVMPNGGNVTALNIIFRDTIPQGTSFVPNSVTVDDLPIAGVNPSLGITLPDTPPGVTRTLTFRVRINCT